MNGSQGLKDASQVVRQKEGTKQTKILICRVDGVHKHTNSDTFIVVIIIIIIIIIMTVGGNFSHCSPSTAQLPLKRS
jgi:hypothetical protein